MKIAVIDTTLDGELIGGAQIFLPKLLKGLIAKDNEIHLITKGAPNEKIRQQIEESKAILHTNLWNADDFVEETAPILAKWLNELNPDLFLISVSPDIAWVVLPLLSPKIASAAIVHSDQDTFYLPINHYSEYLSGVIGVSQDICNKLETRCNLNKSRINWIPYGVEIRESQIEKNSQPIQLIYVGRLERIDKRSEDVIKIVKELERQNINYKFKIVGDGSLKSDFTTELNNELKSGKVELLGWLESKKVLLHLRQSDVFVLTSDSEGFCIAMIEAAGNGCCLLVTDIPGGNQQLVKNGENGFLITVGEISDFVERINWLSENPDELFVLRENALRSGYGFSIQKMVDSYNECFLRSVKDAKENPRQPNFNFPLMESCRSKYPLWLRRIKAKVKKYVQVN